MTSDFSNIDLIAVTDFFFSWSIKSGEGSSSESLADSLKFELGGDSDDHDLILFEVVQHEFTDGSSGDDEVDLGLSDFLDDFFGEILFTLGVVEEFLGLANKDGSLGFSLLRVKGLSVAGNSGLVNSGDGSFSTSGNN